MNSKGGFTVKFFYTCISFQGSSCFASRLFMLSIDHKVVNDQILTSSLQSVLCLVATTAWTSTIPWNLAPHLNFFRGNSFTFPLPFPFSFFYFLHCIVFYYGLLCLSRCFFNINPEKGTKVEKTKKKTLHVNPRVLTLIADLSDHEWRETV